LYYFILLNSCGSSENSVKNIKTSNFTIDNSILYMNFNENINNLSKVKLETEWVGAASYGDSTHRQGIRLSSEKNNHVKVKHHDPGTPALNFY